MDWHLLSPEISMAVLAIAVILLDLVLEDKKKLAVFSTVGLIVPLAFTISLWDENATTMNGMLSVDNFAMFFNILFIAVTAMVLMSSWEYVTAKIENFRGEFFALIILSALGLMLMAAAREMISIFVSLELSGMALYGLTAFLKDKKSTESGLKYIILGGIASATLLYGMIIIFGLTGETQLDKIASSLAASGLREPALFLGVVLIASGFAFKIGAVPFQMWMPDVYEGAPTPVTAYLSVASKAAGFAVIMRIFFIAFESPEWLFNDWSVLFGVLAAVTMTVGNVMALMQSNIKRLLAYSGIAQAGYLLVGLAAANSAGQSGILFYLSVYTLANLGAFIVIIAVSNRINSDEIEDYSGMIRRSPIMALVLATCLISLTGIPPTAGFMGKLVIFKAAMDEGMLWLVIFATVNSVIAAFYYFRVIKAMFTGEARSMSSIRCNIAMKATLIVSIAGVLVLGIYPYLLIKYAEFATMFVP